MPSEAWHGAVADQHWRCNVNEKETFVVEANAVAPSLSSLTHAKSVPSGMEPSINVTSVGTDTMSNSVL